MHVLSREARDVDLFSGRLDEERLRRIFDSLVPVDTVDEWYLCGPFSLVENAREVLAAEGVDKDHVHFLVQSVPTYSVSKLVMIIKSLTAREIFRRCPEVKKRLWGGEFWTDGYFASTVGRHGNEKAIGAYVRRQGSGYRKLHEERQLALF